MSHFELVEQLYLRRTKLVILLPYIKILLTFQKGLKEVDQLALQTALLEKTVLNPLTDQFPVSRSYRQQFLGQLIRVLEELYSESDQVCDSIYEIYGNSLNSPPESPSFLNSNSELTDLLASDPNLGFVTHKIGHSRSNLITASILESNQLVSEGTTGFRTWPAALHLMEYLLDEKNTEKLLRANVLELGAGAGLLGVGLLRGGFLSTKSGHYMFTDHNESVLKRIQVNLGVNSLDNSSQARLSSLDWCALTEANLTGPYDLILAADVIFDPELVTTGLIPALYRLMVAFQKTSNRPTGCLICCAERNLDLLNLFEAKLSEAGLKGKVIHRLEEPTWMHRLREHLDRLKSETTLWMIEKYLDHVEHLDADTVPSRIYQITRV